MTSGKMGLWARMIYLEVAPGVVLGVMDSIPAFVGEVVNGDVSTAEVVIEPEEWVR